MLLPLLLFGLRTQTQLGRGHLGRHCDRHGAFTDYTARTTIENLKDKQIKIIHLIGDRDAAGFKHIFTREAYSLLFAFFVRGHYHR